MKSYSNYDITVSGAGISGLLIASQLSQDHSVIILEKEKAIPGNKYWLTDKKSSLKNPELLECVDSEYKHLDFQAYDGTSFRCEGEYLLWDTELLTKKLEDIITSNNGIILKKHTFYSYKYTKGNIIVNANEKKIASKLLIDCMGYSSPIIYAKRLVQIKGYYILHGRTLNLKKEVNPIGLSNISISSKPKYLEVFPKRNGQAYVVLIEPAKSIVSSGSLKSEFKFLIERSEYSQYFDNLDKDEKHLWGIIPVGVLKSNSLDRIFLFGEAGQMNPSATATCFTQLLYSYKEISEKISKKVNDGKLKCTDLTIENPYLTRMNRKFHLYLFNNILNWNSDKFKELILQMQKMDNDFVNDIIFGMVSFNKYRNMRIFINLIKNGNYFVLNPLLKSYINS